MNTNQLMTAGAIGFAAFAAYYVLKKPKAAVALQPGQAQRDADLYTFNELMAQQAGEFANAIQSSNFQLWGTINYGPSL